MLDLCGQLPCTVSTHIGVIYQLLIFTENSYPCRDLNPGPHQYQADMLPIELSWLGSFKHFNPFIEWMFQLKKPH